MKITEDHLKFIIGRDLEAYGNNTRMCIGFWKECAEQQGYDWPEWLDGVIMKWKPESIVRARRLFVDSTDEQLKEQDKYKNMEI